MSNDERMRIWRASSNLRFFLIRITALMIQSLKKACLLDAQIESNLITRFLQKYFTIFLRGNGGSVFSRKQTILNTKPFQMALITILEKERISVLELLLINVSSSKLSFLSESVAN